MAEKYWENEEPETYEFGKNQVRYYPKAGKLQIYPLAPNTPHGVGRGATLDLAAMSIEEVKELKTVIDGILDDSMSDEIE